MLSEERDQDTLEDALLKLHEERDLDEFRETSPTILLNAVPGDYFVWMESLIVSPAEPLHNTMRWEHPPRLKPRHVARLDQLAVKHPFMLHARKTGNWGPMRLSDFWTDEQLQGSDHWRAAYRELKVGRLLSCTAFRGNRIGTINICRPLGAPDFSDRDLAMLGLLTPHYMQALHAAEGVTAHRDRGTQPLASLGLTPREVDIAVWLARGRTNPEIAAILSLRPRTVEKHVERMLSKLGTRNRTAAAMLISGTVVLKARPAPGPEAAAPGVGTRPKARKQTKRTSRR